MTAPASYRRDGDIGWIELDDGKVNALSPTMQAAVNDALDRAEADGVVVVLRGREGRFSAGFDLGVLSSDAAAGADMVDGGFRLARRLLAHRRPVLIACTGHAIAMGSFLLLAADGRIGVDGPFRVQANEVAIGMTMPHTALTLMRHRLTPAGCSRAAVLSQAHTPAEAVAVGFLDEIVPAADFEERVREAALDAAKLDPGAHVLSKRRMRAQLLAELDEAIETDRSELTATLAAAGVD
ncbi:MAG: crotonase/enoyl-CoA hydratase family protein [Actinomycetota bacterium]